MNHPDRSECAPYYRGYIDELPIGEIDILQILAGQIEKTCGLLQSVDEEQSLRCYAPGKWNIKEIVGHLIDAERVFTYRALSFARNDPSPLPSMEQDDWVRQAGSDKRPLADLLEELRRVRASSLSLFTSFDEEMLMRKGFASGAEFTVRTFPYIIAGHELHHQRVLKERYL
jgi:hypothetical protein